MMFFRQRFFQISVTSSGLLVALQMIVEFVHHASHLQSVYASSGRYSGTEKKRVRPIVRLAGIGNTNLPIKAGSNPPDAKEGEVSETCVGDIVWAGMMVLTKRKEKCTVISPLCGD